MNKQENRIYRIGSKINVNVYYQLFENTVSFRMWKTLNIKKILYLLL